MEHQPQMILGLVIRTAKQGEYNRILKIATESGEISAIAYGSMRPKSNLVFLNQPFVYANFEFKKSKGNLLSVSQSELINNFYNLRYSLEKLETATKICKIIEKSIFEGADFPLSFVLNTLHILEKSNDEKIKVILPIFILRYLTEIGFPPKEEDPIINYITKNKISKIYNIKLNEKNLELITLQAHRLAKDVL